MEATEFEHIAERLRQQAVSAATTCKDCADTPEDVAQEVMLRLWTLRSAIKDTQHAERLSVCIARHIVIDRMRRKRSMPLEYGRGVADSNHSRPDTDAESSDDAAWLEQRMGSLPPKEYQILRMRQVEQLSNGEIAKLLGIEKTSVATLLSRARLKLFNEIKRRINS